MPFNVDPNLNGWLVAGTMSISGLILGIISDRLLRLIGICDRAERR